MTGRSRTTVFENIRDGDALDEGQLDALLGVLEQGDPSLDLRLGAIAVGAPTVVLRRVRRGDDLGPRMELHVAPGEPATALPAEGARVALIVRLAGRRFLMPLTVLAVDAATGGPARVTVSAPDYALAGERRRFRRVAVSEWPPALVGYPIGAGDAAPEGTVVDVSEGGLAVLVARNHPLAGAVLGAACRLSLQVPSEPMRLELEAEVRHRAHQDDGRVRVGLEFGHDLAFRLAREAIARWIGSRQRELARIRARDPLA